MINYTIVERDDLNDGGRAVDCIADVDQLADWVQKFGQQGKIYEIKPVYFEELKESNLSKNIQTNQSFKIKCKQLFAKLGALFSPKSDF